MRLVLHASTTRHDEWRGSKRYFRIVVHDTTADLQRGAERYIRRKWGVKENFSGVGGMYHPPPGKEKFSKVADRWLPTSDPQWGGVIRLSCEQLTSEVVVHECTHAALFIYRREVNVQAEIGEDCGFQEEALAYMVGDISAVVNTAIHEAGLWKTS